MRLLTMIFLMMMNLTAQWLSHCTFAICVSGTHGVGEILLQSYKNNPKINFHMPNCHAW